MSEESHKLAAIVFTDIVGYTSRMEESEQRTMLLLQKQREIVFPIVKSYGGEVVKELGDGLLLMFGSAVEAVRCAISIQTRLKDEELTIRAGIHIGDVIFKDGDVFGSAVNAAARIQPLASQNGVCISEDVKNQIQNKGFTYNTIGKKELKGFREPVEIFELFIEGVSKPKKITLQSFVSDLWSRRVILTLAVYIASAWIIKLAVSSYFTYNVYVVELVWVILLSLIPTVFLLSYFHCRRSLGKWTRAEIIGLPANVVFSIVLTILMFKEKDLGATTTTLSTLDEQGNKIERSIPKKEFRKNAIIFFFENNTGDTSNNWLQFALSNLIEYDLSQDIYLDVQSALNYISKISNAGYVEGTGTPFQLKKKVAQEAYKNLFLTGSFSVQNGNYIIDTELFDSQTGKQIASHQYSEKDFMKAVDAISVDFKIDCDIPEKHISETVDLPVGEIYTSSISALESFTKGYLEIVFKNNWPEGVKLTEKSLKEDPGFTAAHLAAAQFYFNNNQSEKALPSLQMAMDNLYKLPERQQFFTKYFYFIIQKEADKAHAICKMWTDLYPEDIQAHTMLAENYKKQDQMQLAIAEYKKILELDHQQYNIVRVVGNLYEQSAKYDSAAYYYGRYAKQFPDDFKSYRDLGELYMLMTDFAKAKENFDKALLIEPSNISVMLALANLEIRNGSFDQAINLFQTALASSRSSSDSSKVYFGLDNYYELKGQMKKSLDYHLLGMNSFARNSPPKNVLVQSTFSIEKYVLAGNKDAALKLLKKIHDEFQPPLDKVAAFGYLFYYIETGDPDNAEKHIPDAMEVISGFGEQVLMANVYYAKGRISELRMNYKEALENYIQFSRMQPNSFHAYQWISLCYRELGDLNKAKENILLALKHNPFNPEFNLEAAMVFTKTGEKSKVKEHLERALNVWDSADKDYKPYQKAKAMASQIIN